MKYERTKFKGFVIVFKKDAKYEDAIKLYNTIFKAIKKHSVVKRIEILSTFNIHFDRQRKEDLKKLLQTK